MKRVHFGLVRFRYDCKTRRYGTPLRRVQPSHAALHALPHRQYQARSSHSNSCKPNSGTNHAGSASDQQRDDDVGEEIQGLSGRRYTIEKILQDKHMPLGRVYLARFVLPVQLHSAARPD